MNLILYDPVIEGNSKKLLYRIIENLNLDSRLEIYHTLGSLSHRLSQPKEDSAIAVLFAARRKDLLDILSIKKLLNYIQIILILPDGEEDTIMKGHTLRPRFLTYNDSDLEEVAAVVGKMLSNSYRE